jgi:hypothetical protein
MGNLAKRTPQQKEKFSVPQGTDILLFLKNLQHWAIEHEYEDIRRLAHEVQESYKRLHDGIIENANLMLLVQHELDNTCERVQEEHRDRARIAECHYLERFHLVESEYTRQYSAWREMEKEELEDRNSLDQHHVTRYWQAWRDLFEKLDIVIRQDGHHG